MAKSTDDVAHSAGEGKRAVGTGTRNGHGSASRIGG